MLQYGSPGREGSMEKARKRWNIQTLFLTPQEVFDAFANRIYSFKIPIKNFEEYKQKYPEQAEAIFSTKYFGIPEDPLERKNYFLQNSLAFFNQSLIEGIYNVAKKIMATTKQSDYIVIFGNTPYFVGRALQKLISSDPSNPNHRTLIEFPFSGSPNRARALNFPDYRNFVTEDRLVHLQERLKLAGLTPENKDLQKNSVYFVDVIASGAGLAYVIEDLLRTFAKAEVPAPNFNIITLNKINIDNPDDTRNAKIADKNANDGDHLTLYFPSKEDLHFSIDANVIFLKGHTLLDQLPSHDWRIFPEYNAAYWQSEYDYLLHKPQQKFTKTLLEYFDTNIDALMHKNEKNEENKNLEGREKITE